MDLPLVLRLKSQWTIKGELGRGGFGRVYYGTGPHNQSIVAKFVPKEPGATRELLFEDVHAKNVIPILDSGEYGDAYVLVMPRAEESLRQFLQRNPGPMEKEVALPILRDIATALADLKGSVVHRDLKPENILYLDAAWCLADFGIARYAEATTSENTHKYAKTPPYAAPEQWRGERATHATDVYAFGVIAFEMLAGNRPFGGPHYREQHLNSTPMLLGGIPTLANLISECLYKAPASRPLAANIVERLKNITDPPSGAIKKLQEVNLRLTQVKAEQLSEVSLIVSAKEVSEELFEIASQSLDKIIDRMMAEAIEAAPKIRMVDVGGKSIELDQGVLLVDQVQRNDAAANNEKKRIDVVASSAIHVLQTTKGSSDYSGRSHSLWFCDAHDQGSYRWFELAFMGSPLIGKYSVREPYALSPEDGLPILEPVMGTQQIAWEPLAFDQGDEAAFIDRWLSWFAEVAEGKMERPRALPEISGGHYRR